MTRSVGFVGGGHARRGDRDATDEDLVREAGTATFDAVPDLAPGDVGGLFVGSVRPERFALQTHVAPLVAELPGIDVDGTSPSSSASRG